MRDIFLSFRICAQRFPKPGKQCDYLRSRRLIQVLTLFVLLVPLEWAVPMQQVSYGEQQQVAQEYELKAVYLYNFLQFVQWPESRLMHLQEGAMVIGIVGESPFGKAFEELQATIRKTGKKPVRIVYYGPYQVGMDMTNCHLLFLCASEKKNFAKIIARLGDTQVLTVADTENFLSSGGMVILVKAQGKIRWMINRAQADRVGLRFSAQLLALAVKVVGD